MSAVRDEAGFRKSRGRRRIAPQNERISSKSLTYFLRTGSLLQDFMIFEKGFCLGGQLQGRELLVGLGTHLGFVEEILRLFQKTSLPSVRDRVFSETDQAEPEVQGKLPPSLVHMTGRKFLDLRVRNGNVIPSTVLDGMSRSSFVQRIWDLWGRYHPEVNSKNLNNQARSIGLRSTRIPKPIVHRHRLRPLSDYRKAAFSKRNWEAIYIWGCQ